MRTKRAFLAAGVLSISPASAWAQSAAYSLSPGTISIEVPDAAPDVRASVPTFVGAVEQALSARGFTTIEQPGHAGLVAALAVRRSAVGTVSAKVAPSRSSAAPGNAPGVGAGVSFALPSTKMRMVPLQQTRLELRIHKRGQDTVLWQGTAMTVRGAGTPKGNDEAVATDLIDALMRAYPAQPEDVISVP
jgi:hypothetical protein